MFIFFNLHLLFPILAKPALLIMTDLMDNLLIGCHISSYAVRGKFVRVQR